MSKLVPRHEIVKFWTYLQICTSVSFSSSFCSKVDHACNNYARKVSLGTMLCMHVYMHNRGKIIL